MRPVAVNYGDVFYAGVFKGNELVGEIVSYTCLSPEVVTPTVTETINQQIGTNTPSTGTNKPNTQFDGIWGSADW
jgi:hypothetical protein